MSTPQNRPAFPNRRTNDNRRGGSRRPDGPPGVCRVCKEAQALPHEETCESCGAHVIERTRASVDAWLSMHADRVKELERVELEQLARAEQAAAN